MDEEVSLRNLFLPLTVKKVFVFIFLLGFLVNFYGLFNAFVGDDTPQIIDNPLVHSVAYIPTFFVADRLNNGQLSALGSAYFKPILDTAFALIYSVAGPYPFLFHFVQLLLFITNSFFVFLFLRKHFAQEMAFVAALVFLLHPINSEVVLYISALQEVLFFFFGMLALLTLQQNFALVRTTLLVGFFLLLSMLSKETGVLFIPIVVLYSFIFKRKYAASVAGISLMVAGGYAFLRVHSIGWHNTDIINAPIQRLSLLDRIINIPEILWFYVRTFLFPLNLSSSYQWVRTTITLEHFFFPLMLVILFAGLVIYIAYFIKKAKNLLHFKEFLFFVSWFSLGILLHLQLVPLDQTVAERWFYFPFVGLLGMITVAIKAFKVPVGNKKLSYGFIAILLLFGIRTFARGTDYKDDFTLASRDISVSPDAYNLEYQLSHKYYVDGNLELAKVHAVRSVELFPYITNYTNLGAIYSRQGNFEKAKESYLMAMRFGDDALPYENLAGLAMVYGDKKENVDYLKNVALKKYPQNGTIWLRLAIISNGIGDNTEARHAISMAKKFSKDEMIEFVDQIIQNNKALQVKATDGIINFIVK